MLFSVNGNVYRGDAGAARAGRDLRRPAPTCAWARSTPTAPTSPGAGSARSTAAAASACRPTSTTRGAKCRRPLPNRCNIADLQFQHSLPAWGAHSLVWGANYRAQLGPRHQQRGHRLPAGARSSRPGPACSPRTKSRCVPTCRLTLGARIERNDYTGNELLPTARLSWRLAPRHALWAAALAHGARADPARRRRLHSRDARRSCCAAGQTVRAEVAQRVRTRLPRPAAAAACRIRRRCSINDYDHLRTQEIDPTCTFLTFGSLMEGQATGIEMWGSYQLSRAWRMSAGYHGAARAPAPESRQQRPGRAGHCRQGSGAHPAAALELQPRRARELELGLRKVAALDNPRGARLLGAGRALRLAPAAATWNCRSWGAT